MSAPVATRIPGFTLRLATEADVGLIFKFVRELAEYERLSHEVIATEELLRAHLFGGRSVAEVVIAEFEQQPVGFALFFHNFSTFIGKPGIYLEDLYVQPQYRGRGFGEVLLTYVGKLAEERGCGRFEWSVLDWNAPAIGFYRKMGAVPMDQWTVYRITGDALEQVARRF